MKRIIAMVALVIAVVGMAHLIETQARPATGREGRKIEAGHDH